MFQKQGASALRLGLNNILSILNILDNPHKQLKTVHVAGTNGKGSVCSFTASILQESGYKVGLFTSPHLEDYRERIRVNGEMIPEAAVLRFMNTYYPLLQTLDASFFEVTTAMAFWWFKEAGADISLIETGMGGRLDCTNVLIPEVVVITKIGFDHQQYLGSTLEAIAREKAGIIKETVPSVFWDTSTPVTEIIEATAKQNNGACIQVNKPLNLPEFPLILQENLALVAQVIELLKQKGWVIPPTAWQQGLTNCIANTGMQGRWQLLHISPTLIVDVGHNIDGMQHIVKQLLSENKSVHFIFGMGADKDIDGIMDILPKHFTYYFTQANTPRALPAKDLLQRAINKKLVGKCYSQVSEAVKTAFKNCKTEEIIFLGGSFFVVGEFLNYWKSEGKEIITKKVT